MTCVGVTGEVSESKQFEWQIADFFSLSTKKYEFYKSPSFIIHNTSLHLYIYPGGSVNAKYGFISVFLRNESCIPLHVSKIIQIKKSDGTLIGGGYGDAPIDPCMGFPNFYRRCDLEQRKAELVPSGILTINCIFKLNQDGKRTNQTSDHPRLTELYILSENLRDFSADKDSCDVVLHVENKKFKVHKAILMARSSVFAAMFKHDTLEKQTGFVKIPDCDSETFQEFLDYLYCGKLQNVSLRSALHLYCTSNKYDVQKLKEFCIEYLIETLTVDNLCDIVKLADKYDDKKLITVTQDFFNENWNIIFPSTEWENLMKNNYRLANKLLIEYSKTKSSQ